jgi:hypothetical protein
LDLEEDDDDDGDAGLEIPASMMIDGSNNLLPKKKIMISGFR